MSAFDSIARLVAEAKERLVRNREAPLSMVLVRGAQYAMGRATAPLHLWNVNRVGRGVRTQGRPRIENFGRIEIGDGVNLKGVPFRVELVCGPGARLSIGDDTFVNYATSIAATGSITIGARVNVGPFVMIIDTSFHDPYDRNAVPPAKPIVIEDDVFLGAKCSVMPGVTIGRGAIVGAHAVVTKDVAPFTVVAGVPARKVDEIDARKFVVSAR
jgi:maltose O-acetyltransferase